MGNNEKSQKTEKPVVWQQRQQHQLIRQETKVNPARIVTKVKFVAVQIRIKQASALAMRMPVILRDLKRSAETIDNATIKIHVL